MRHEPTHYRRREHHGRRLLTPEEAQWVTSSLYAAGASLATVSKEMGLNPSTVRSWVMRGSRMLPHDIQRLFAFVTNKKPKNTTKGPDDFVQHSP